MDAKTLEGWVADASSLFVDKQEVSTDDRGVWEKQAANATPEPELDLLGAGVTGEQARYESTRELQEEDFQSLFERGLRTSNALRGIFDETVRKASYEPDPNFDLKAHFAAVTEGIPSMYHDKFSRAQSLEEAWDVHRGIKSDLEDMQVLGDNGVTGTVAMIAAGVIDVDAVVPFLGKATQVTKAVQLASDAKKITMAQKAIHTLQTAGKAWTAKAIAKVDSIAGGAWAGAKAAMVTEAVLAEVGDTNQWADVPVAMLMSGAFGGAIRMTQGIPVGLSTREVGSGKSVNLATDLAENAADPTFTRQLDDKLEGNLNSYTGAGVFGDRMQQADLRARAAAFAGTLQPLQAFASGWLQKARGALKAAPFDDDFTRL